MKKVTQENIKELATDLLDSVGKESFMKGKIYYKEGQVKLSVKPLDAELYVDEARTKGLYVQAEDAVTNRKKGKFKENLIEFAKHKAVIESNEEQKELVNVYNMIRANYGTFKQALTLYRKTALGNVLLKPTNGNQEEAYNRFKQAIEKLGYTFTPYANEPKFYVYPKRGFDSAGLTSLINAYNLMEKYTLQEFIEAVTKDWSHEEITDFIKLPAIYNRFMVEYGDLPEKASKVIHLMGEYEKSRNQGYNLQIIKRIKSMGYEPLQVIIQDGVVTDFSIYPNSRDGLFLPEIMLTTNGVKKLKIQTTAVGMLTSDELKGHLAGYQVAMSIVDILESVKDMYFIADYD